MQFKARVTVEQDLGGQMDALNEIQTADVRGKDSQIDVAVFIGLVRQLRSEKVKRLQSGPSPGHVLIQHQ